MSRALQQNIEKQHNFFFFFSLSLLCTIPKLKFMDMYRQDSNVNLFLEHLKLLKETK